MCKDKRGAIPAMCICYSWSHDAGVCLHSPVLVQGYSFYVFCPFCKTSGSQGADETEAIERWNSLMGQYKVEEFRRNQSGGVPKEPDRERLTEEWTTYREGD
jgi:hypothetical protein